MNKVLNKIIIGGTSASFKSLLCMQIDNHPDVNVIHRHDKILQIFIKPFANFSLFKEKYLKQQNEINYTIIKKNKLKKLIFKNNKKKIFFSPILLRKLLIDHTGYYVNEQYAWQKKIGSDVSSLSSSSKKFDFEFYKYDKYIFNKIFNSKITNFSPEFLYDIFLESFIYSQNKKLKKNILFMAPNNYESIDFLMKEKFNIKVIYLLRNSENIVLSRAIRQIVNEENITDKRLVQKKINKKIENILYANFYKSVLSQEKKIFQLEKINKKKLKIVKSEDFIYKNPKTIKDITQWLGIKNHKSLKDLYYEGSKMDKKKYLDKINDDDFIIDNSIKNFFYIQKHGIKNFIFNCKNKSLKVLIFLIKQFIYKNFK
ncbi:hypothetical protein VP91_00002270 [Candidatus Pelagibacter ubique]|uniref:Uncharacterized protein n=1 Tax=Pelagibacter ubique TaxID=198252 RepID=A0ABX1T204_PELUQ|nr:hypothetical protein [Candidatus Pelagibacter ubique]NMN67094.1 hypothetical protein [Candidatus Pelagibacter ubique]